MHIQSRDHKTPSYLTQFLYVVFGLFVLSVSWQTRYIFAPTDNPYTTLGIYGFDIIFAGLLITFIFWWYLNRQAKLPLMVLLLSSGLAILVLLSAYWSLDREVSFYYWIRLVQALVILNMVIAVRPPVRVLLHAFVVNSLVQSGFAFWQTVSQHVVANKWLGMSAQSPETSGVPVVLTQTGRFLRAFGTMPHPNIAGGVIALGLVSAVVLWQLLSRSDHGTKQLTTHFSRHFRNLVQIERYYILIATAVMSLGLVVTFSRSALLAWGLVIITMTVWEQRMHKRINTTFTPILLTSLVMLLLAAIVYAPMLSSRLQASTYVETISLHERSGQLRQAWELWPKYILQGTGIGAYTLALDHSEQIEAPAEPLHVMPWLILMEIGVLAGIVLFWLVGWSVWQTRWHNSNSFGMTIVLCTALFIGLFDHYFWTLPSMILMLSLIIGSQVNAALPDSHVHNDTA